MKILFASVLVILLSVYIALPSHAQAANSGGLSALPNLLDLRDEDSAPMPEKIPAPDTILAPEAEPEGIDPDLMAPTDNAQNSTLYDDVPLEYLREAEEYGQTCQNSAQMIKFYDCRCMTVEYLDQRVKLGAEADPSAIKAVVTPKCADATGISGSLYQECLRDPFMSPKGFDPEEYCECYGNIYGKIYENLGRKLGSRDHIRMMTQARSYCARPQDIPPFLR